MIFSFLFFLFLLSPFSPVPSPVYSDDFNIMGDSRYCNLRHTTAVSVSFLPESKKGPSSLFYSTEDLEGRETQDVISNENVFTLTEIFAWRRIHDVETSVSGPPGTKINILYAYLNEAGHSIDVSSVVVPFSQGNFDEGNWLEVISTSTALPEERTISVFFDLRWVQKSGLLKEYQGPGELEDMQEGFLLLDTLEIVNPIKILDVQIENLEPGDGVRISVEIENISKEDLVDISFEHLDNNFEFTMQPNEVVKLEYEVGDLSQEGSSDLGYFKIHNPNTNTQCAIYGNPNNAWFSGEGVTVTAFREDGGWVNGAIVQPEGDTYCISRIPYTMTSELLEYQNDGHDEEDDVAIDIINGEDTVVVEDIQSHQEEAGIERFEEVLGVSSVLPKTGVVNKRK